MGRSTFISFIVLVIGIFIAPYQLRFWTSSIFQHQRILSACLSFKQVSPSSIDLQVK